MKRACRLFAGAAVLAGVMLPPATAGLPGADESAFIRQQPSADAREVMEWVAREADNKGLPFMIIDKKNARLFVFGPDARFIGSAPVLLGSAKGDDTTPGIGDKKLSEIKPEERTTPAGRFQAEVGRNARGEDVVWVDYNAGVSMHRVITSDPAEQRLERLATPSVADNRISYGCINVPKAFFENVLNKAINGGNSVVYVLPEVKPLASV
ncbi:MAG TPA: hypothetical protein VFP68_04545, partial [Burkholderiaceae bacterium]|nr:hypothetical protein [Burkholderiaceae bacterium]